MKILSLLLAIALTGCYALSNPQGAAQGVKMIDLKTQTYKTTCSGAVEEWANCFARASQTCSKGYENVERIESPTGGRREIVFQCK